MKLSGEETRYTTQEKELLVSDPFLEVGRENRVADALSRRADLAFLRRIAPILARRVTNSIRELIAENLQKNIEAVAIMELAKKGQNKTFWLKNELLMTKGPQMFVPRAGDLR
ncbi:hypothetical protein V6N13_135822 [Hibiscus sabdariffa]